jgi:hypothetical protein
MALLESGFLVGSLRKGAYPAALCVAAAATLGREYANVDEFERSLESTSRAWQLREHPSDREKFFIDANYQILATGNLEQARQTCEGLVPSVGRGTQAAARSLSSVFAEG